MSLNQVANFPKPWQDVSLFGPVPVLPITNGANAPSAIYDAQSNSTFVVFHGRGRFINILRVDHTTGFVGQPIELTSTYDAATTEARGTPAIAIDGSGYIHVVYFAPDNVMRWTKSPTPRAITGTWPAMTTPAGTPKGTFPAMVYEPTSSKVWLVFRSGDSHRATYPSHEYAALWSYNGTTWTDEGATSPAGKGGVIDLTGNGATAKDFCFPNLTHYNGKLRLIWGVATGSSHDGSKGDIFAARIDVQTKNITPFDDSANATMPLSWTQATANYRILDDHPTDLAAMTDDRVASIYTTTDTDGKQLVVFGRKDGANNGIISSLFWDGSAWSAATNIAGSGTTIFGGNPHNARILAAAVYRDGPTYEVFATREGQVERYTTPVGSLSYTKQEVLVHTFTGGCIPLAMGVRGGGPLRCLVGGYNPYSLSGRTTEIRALTRDQTLTIQPLTTAMIQPIGPFPIINETVSTLEKQFGVLRAFATGAAEIPIRGGWSNVFAVICNIQLVGDAAVNQTGVFTVKLNEGDTPFAVGGSGRQDVTLTCLRQGRLSAQVMIPVGTGGNIKYVADNAWGTIQLDVIGYHFL